MIYVPAHLGKEAGAHMRVVIEELFVDLGDGVGGSVHKFRDVGGAVGGGEVRQHYGRAALTLFVDVGQKELRVGGVGLGGEDQPAAVGGPTVPGVHSRRVALEPTRLAALGRDDIQRAVRLQQHVIAGLAEDDPL